MPSITGRISYLVFGQTDQWKAVIGGQQHGGTFNQVIDQMPTWSFTT